MPTDPIARRLAPPQFFDTALAFRAWLTAHGATATELLVGYRKVGSGRPSMSWPESVDEALCFGWIDGVRKRIEDDTYSIRFTPRKKSSIWSVINMAKFEHLAAAGRITPAGTSAFAHRTEAKSAVYAYEQVATAELSAAEVRKFKRIKVAWKFFAATPPSYKKVILHWVTSAKRIDTRQSRFAKLVEACAAGNRLR